MTAKIEAQRAFFHAGKTRPVEGRCARLEQLRRAINTHHLDVLDALKADLGKSPQEAYASEVAYVLGDIRHALRHIRSWTKPDHKRTPLSLWPARSRVVAGPYGVSLILGPWNYPFQLLLSPLVSAVAAGNCVVLKPSEHAPQTAEVVQRIIADAFPPEWVTVAQGGEEVAKGLLRKRFDKIFFTGGAAVGRLVMKAAAEHLTPVTLELGGKCPCIVTAKTDIKVAARRIVWGKFMNAGQTCVAPDHLWVERRSMDALLEHIKRVLGEFYGGDPRRSPDYGRIVNGRQFDRLIAYLNEGTIEVGGEHERNDLYIAPTVMTHVAEDSKVMDEEIFGPVLPVRPYDSIEDVLDELQKQPTPLALYLFSDDRGQQDKVLSRVRSGGVCINDAISHLLNRNLPFGGLGESGMGACHGKAGFDAFSHQRSVMKRGMKPDPGFRYPPMRSGVDRLRRVLKWFGEG